MTRKWTVRMFGELRAERGDRVVTRFRGRRAGALLARLAFPPLRAHPRERLIDLLWGDEALELANPRQSLSQEIYSLRNQLAEPDLPKHRIIESSRDEVWLGADVFDSDVQAFEAALDAADRARTDLERARRLEQAARLYRGELLPGSYDEWVVAERYRLAELHLRALRELVAIAEDEGDAAGAIDHAAALVAADPLDEAAHRALIRLHALAGRAGSAERQYATLVEVLQTELGVGPAPETEALIEAVRAAARAAGEPVDGGGDSAARGGDLDPMMEAGSARSIGSAGRRGDLPAGIGGDPRPAATVTALLFEIGGAGSGGSGADAPDRAPAFESVVAANGGSTRPASGGWATAVFGRASDALRAAEQLADGSARIGLATGEVAAGTDERGVIEAASWIAIAARPGRILASASTAALVQRTEHGGRVHDRGLWTIGGSAHPVRLFQLVVDGMSTADGAPVEGERAALGRLPARFSRFFGREDEQRALAGMLSAPDRRLVTLFGPAGVGKTRLALEVVEASIEAFDGAVWFAPLAGLEDGAHIADQIASAIGTSVTAGGDALDAIVVALSERPSLLLLDNAEHLVGALVPLVSALLQRASETTLFVTSQRRLGLQAEHVVPLAPLPVPVEPTGSVDDAEIEALLALPSVALFADRAREAFPEFRLAGHNAAAVAEICRRLDGVPLAIELAASRVAVLSPPRLLEQLDDRFGVLVSRHRDGDPRHRALDSAIEWAVRLLGEEERRVFAELSVFRGGFSLDAARAVCSFDQGSRDQPSKAGSGDAMRNGGAIGDHGLLDTISRLLDAALVTVDAGVADRRFRMLESLRAYGAGMLGPEETAALQERHARWTLELARRAEPGLVGREQVTWLDRLDVERDNIRAALDWCVEAGEAETGLEIGGALWRYWYLRGSSIEGLRWLTMLFEVRGPDTAAPPTRPIARAMHGLGTLAYLQSRHETARTWLTKCLEAQRALGDPSGEAAALNNLGMVAQRASDVPEAARRYRQALEIKTRIGDEVGALTSRINLATVALILDDLDTARAEAESAVEDADAVGDLWSRSRALVLVGFTELAAGNAEAATRRLQESLGLQEAIGDHASILGTLLALASARLRLGDSSKAAALIDRAERSVGDHTDITVRADLLAAKGEMALHGDDAAAATPFFAECIAIQSRLGREHHRVTAELWLAWSHVMLGDLESASGIVRKAMGMRHQPPRITALALDVCAARALAGGDRQRAYQLSACAETLRTAVGIAAPTPTRRYLLERLSDPRGAARAQRAASRAQAEALSQEDALLAAIASLAEVVGDTE